MIGFLDIETGGFSVEKNGVCEIALVVADADYKIVDEFHCLIHPYYRPGSMESVSYKEDAMQINGLTVERLIAEGIAVDVAMNSFMDFYTKNNISKIIGHNIPAFDIPRVRHLLHRFTNHVLSYNEAVCTLEMARKKLKGLPSYKQEYLCKYLGIPNPNSHSAKGDCYANIELYKYLINK